jgi:hypothetical protein
LKCSIPNRSQPSQAPAHHGYPGLVGGDRDGLQDARDVADDAVALDRAFQKRRLDAGVVDALGDLADEQRRDCAGGPIREESGELEKRIDAGGDDDLQPGGLRDLANSRHVAAEAGGGRIDDRADPGLAHARELGDRVVHAFALVPVQRTEHVTPVLQCLRVHHEDVLVHQRATKVVHRYRTANGLNRHQRSLRRSGSLPSQPIDAR